MKQHYFSNYKKYLTIQLAIDNIIVTIGKLWFSGGKMIYPKEYLDSVKNISIELLQKNNIKGLILDVDNTLIDFDKKMPDGVETWVQNMKNSGIKFCILSNSNKLEKVGSVAEKLQIPFIHFAKKPFKAGFERAKKVLQLEANEIAVVGDQIMTDIIGANRSKMFSILVKPIEEKEYIITKIKRPIEKIIINSYLKKKKAK